jgi:hypothetical protein
LAGQPLTEFGQCAGWSARQIVGAPPDRRSYPDSGELAVEFQVQSLDRLFERPPVDRPDRLLLYRWGGHEHSMPLA